MRLTQPVENQVVSQYYAITVDLTLRVRIPHAEREVYGPNGDTTENHRVAVMIFTISQLTGERPLRSGERRSVSATWFVYFTSRRAYTATLANDSENFA